MTSRRQCNVVVKCMGPGFILIQFKFWLCYVLVLAICLILDHALTFTPQFLSSTMRIIIISSVCHKAVVKKLNEIIY